MTLEDKAKEYALKALESEIDKVQKAYIDGYNAAKAEYNHEPIDIDGVKYFDMSLPSGTLWSEPIREGNVLLRLPYNKAKQYELPTQEDWEELMQYTKHEVRGGKYKFLSVDGITLNSMKDNGCWLKSDVVNNEALTIRRGNIISNCFIGETVAIVLVKHKNT